jgi:hypothetical protein
MREESMIKKLALILLILFLFTAPVSAGKGSLKIKVFPEPPEISVAVTFSEPSGNKMLDAEETGRLVVTVKNSGKGAAFDVRGEITAGEKVRGIEFKNDIFFGTIPPGKSITREAELKASKKISVEGTEFTVHIREANGFDADPVKIAFNVKTFESPKLVVADMGIDDQNGNSRVEPMEIIELTARIQNVGHGDARGVSVDIKTGENVYIAGEGITHFEIGNVPSGKYNDVKFMFYTNKRIKHGKKIPIQLTVNEERPRYQASEELALTMNVRQKSAREIVINAGKEKEEIAFAKGLSIDVDVKIPKGKKAGKHDIAVVIGNKNYTESGVPAVEFAHRDARIMKEYLIKTFGFRPDNIIYEEDATLSRFNEIFGSKDNYRGKLFNFIKKDVSNVFVYYVGHGAPDLKSEEAYFVPVDANPQYIATNGYKLQSFYNNLSLLPVDKITIVIDSCFSGNSDKGMLFKNISPAMVRVKKQYKGPRNALIITSAAVDEVSSWYGEKKHSLFTYYFFKGLQGDADFDGDDQIIVSEMKKYLKENVPYMARRITGAEQNPVISGDDKETIVTIIK